jgi:hypothetical protein
MRFSSPRTDWGSRYASVERSRARSWSSHAEFADPFAFISFYQGVADHAPDVLLEAKAKDVAVMQSRRDLARYAPGWAAVFGVESAT